MQPAAAEIKSNMTDLNPAACQRQSSEKEAIALHPNDRNMALVWKRLWRMMFTPQGKGVEAQDKGEIHKSETTCVSASHTHAGTYSAVGEKKKGTFCVILLFKGATMFLITERVERPQLNKAQQ